MNASPSPAGAAPAPGPVLRDIHLPPDPSWWPPAPGWWLLAGLLLLVVLLGAWYWRRRRRVSRQRQRWLAELDRLAARHGRDGDYTALATGLHQLLRRVARQHDVLAGQQRGDAWQRTLGRVPVDAATLQQLQALDQYIYRPRQPFDQTAMIAAARHWLRLALHERHWKAPADAPDGKESTHA